jgi:hypothetical protein
MGEEHHQSRGVALLQFKQSKVTSFGEVREAGHLLLGEARARERCQRRCTEGLQVLERKSDSLGNGLRIRHPLHKKLDLPLVLI